MRRESLVSFFLLLTLIFVGVELLDRGSWSTMVFAGAGCLWAILAIWRPQAALSFSFFLVLAAATPFRYRDPLAVRVDEQVIFEFTVYAVVIFVLLVNALRSSRDRPIFPLRLTILEVMLLSYVLLAVASTLWSEDRLITAARSAQLFVLLLLCILGVRVWGPVRILRVLAVSVVAYVFLAASASVLVAGFARPGHRFSWLALHPISAGTYAGTAAIFLLAMALFATDMGHRLSVRVWLWAGFAFPVVILLKTHARGPLLAFGVAAVAMWARKHMAPLTAGVVTCAILGLGALGLVNALNTYTATTDTPETPPTLTLEQRLGGFVLGGQRLQGFMQLSGRVELWSHISSLFHERPILGHGYAASAGLLLARFSWAGEAHGALPQSLLDLGVVGAALLGVTILSALVSVFFADFSSNRPAQWARVVILGLLVFLLVESITEQSFAGVPDYEPLLFFILTVAYGHLHRTMAPEPQAIRRSPPRTAAAAMSGSQINT